MHYCCISVFLKSHLFDSIFVELLDQEEFGDDPVRSDYVENETEVTEELGLSVSMPRMNLNYRILPYCWVEMLIILLAGQCFGAKIGIL